MKQSSAKNVKLMRVKSKIISDQKSLLDSGTFVVTSYVYFLMHKQLYTKNLKCQKT